MVTKIRSVSQTSRVCNNRLSQKVVIHRNVSSQTAAYRRARTVSDSQGARLQIPGVLNPWLEGGKLAMISPE